MSLTADGSAICENCSNLGVKVNHEISLNSDSLVPGLNLFSDPVFEGIPDERIDHVDQPLFWNLSNLV